MTTAEPQTSPKLEPTGDPESDSKLKVKEDDSNVDCKDEQKDASSTIEVTQSNDDDDDDAPSSSNKESVPGDEPQNSKHPEPPVAATDNSDEDPEASSNDNSDGDGGDKPNKESVPKGELLNNIKSEPAAADTAKKERYEILSIKKSNNDDDDEKEVSASDGVDRSEWSFGKKIWAILDRSEKDSKWAEIICWEADGTSFRMKNPKGFVMTIQPEFFPNHTQFKSFTSALSVQGFSKESGSGAKGNSVWSHPDLSRSNRAQTEAMTKASATERQPVDRPRRSRSASAVVDKKDRDDIQNPEKTDNDDDENEKSTTPPDNDGDGDGEDDPSEWSVGKKILAILEKAENDPEWAEIVCWESDGTSFRLNDPKAFEEIIMQEYFPTFNKFVTFRKLLSRCHFKNISSSRNKGDLLLYHPNLSRSNRAQTETIKVPEPKSAPTQKAKRCTRVDSSDEDDDENDDDDKPILELKRKRKNGSKFTSRSKKRTKFSTPDTDEDNEDDGEDACSDSQKNSSSRRRTSKGKPTRSQPPTPIRPQRQAKSDAQIKLFMAREAESRGADEFNDSDLEEQWKRIEISKIEGLESSFDKQNQSEAATEVSCPTKMSSKAFKRLLPRTTKSSVNKKDPPAPIDSDEPPRKQLPKTAHRRKPKAVRSSTESKKRSEEGAIIPSEANDEVLAAEMNNRNQPSPVSDTTTQSFCSDVALAGNSIDGSADASGRITGIEIKNISTLDEISKANRDDVHVGVSGGNLVLFVPPNSHDVDTKSADTLVEEAANNETKKRKHSQGESISTPQTQLEEEKKSEEGSSSAVDNPPPKKQGRTELSEGPTQSTDPHLPLGRRNTRRTRAPSDTGNGPTDDESELPETSADGTGAADGEQPAELPEPAGPEPYEVLDDPNEFYVEEEAHLYHNPPFPSDVTEGVKPNDLRKIPPPPPLPSFPDTGNCEWSYEEENRVLLAKFKSPTMDPLDETFFMLMLERDDITVVSEGLLDMAQLDNEVWSRGYWATVLGSEFYHKFRRFDTIQEDGKEKCKECDVLYSMRMSDYMRYLKCRETFLKDNTADPMFAFEDHKEREQSIHVGTSCLYMIDLDVHRYLPATHSNFMESFRYHNVLPGGKHCMMNSITSNARPFMGPNVYITPPAAFTHFHQDGHGTVDSGHLVITGYNEIVMLRRLTERHKKHALWLLTGDRSAAETSNSKQPKLPEYFDGLYSEPHGDGLGEKPSWPTRERIQECRDMGYCPSVLILKPTQLIHINKGRLHAFRKMSTSRLPEADCHYELRRRLVEEKQLKGEILCISVAWDWMFRGTTSHGINREICSVIEAAILNRKHGKVSLAIPETSLLQMAKTLVPVDQSLSPKNGYGSLLKPATGHDKEVTDSKLVKEDQRKIDICRGILPGLRHVVRQHVEAMESASNKSKLMGRGERVTVISHPNTQENPMDFPVDPYGNSDFFCKLCSKELSNVYYHCDGCETLLSKDFNICRECHAEKNFMIKVQMHPLNNKRHSTINHIGDMHFDRSSRCPCKNGPACKHCSYCSGCSCRCHSWFTLNSRFFGKEGETALLQRVEDAVAKSSGDGNDKYLNDSAFTEHRFALAAKRYD